MTDRSSSVLFHHWSFTHVLCYVFLLGIQEVIAEHSWEGVAPASRGIRHHLQEQWNRHRREIGEPEDQGGVPREEGPVLRQLH